MENIARRRRRCSLRFPGISDGLYSHCSFSFPFSVLCFSFKRGFICALRLWRYIRDELVERYLAKSDRASNYNVPIVDCRQTAVVKDKRVKQQKDKHLILTMEDLSKALCKYGINVKHQEYFADSPSTGIEPATSEDQ